MQLKHIINSGNVILREFPKEWGHRILIRSYLPHAWPDFPLENHQKQPSPQVYFWCPQDDKSHVFLHSFCLSCVTWVVLSKDSSHPNDWCQCHPWMYYFLSVSHKQILTKYDWIPSLLQWESRALALFEG